MRPDLIVPIRDRRARKRYLTLKNAGIAAAVFFVIVAGITIYASRQGGKPGEYGRLLGHQVSQDETAISRHVDVITEAPPVADQGGIDPTLVAPAGREQMLGVNQSAPAAAPAPPAQPVRVAAPVTLVPLGGGSPATPGTDANGQTVAIVGDGSGVAIVRTKGDSTPKLRGGFGRQP